ncbi:MAG: glycosyltransferase family 2 protein, partial [Bacteroidetes bacterium]|nr:glycosyltransferase family 2 protein [Bacteroidota bacterium]
MDNHTFVIPAYKDSQYLEPCIISLKNQSVKSNIIITTSTPSDYIKQIAGKYSIEIIINNSKNKGIAEDWNFALAQANTSYVTIAHQDDLYEQHYTENVLHKLNYYTETLIVFTDYSELLNENTRNNSLNLIVKKLLLFPFMFRSVITLRFFKKLLLLFGDPICCPSVTYNKTKLSGFSFSNKFSCTLDWFAWSEMSKKKGNFIFIKKNLM